MPTGKETLKAPAGTGDSVSSAEANDAMARIRTQLGPVLDEPEEGAGQGTPQDKDAKPDSSAGTRETPASQAEEDVPFHTHPRWQELQGKLKSYEAEKAERDRIIAERERELAEIRAARQREQDALIASLRPDLADKLGVARPTPSREELYEQRLLELAQKHGNGVKAMAAFQAELEKEREERFLAREVWERERYESKAERESRELLERYPEFAEQAPEVQKDFLNVYGPWIMQGAYTLSSAWDAYRTVKLPHLVKKAGAESLEADAARARALEHQGEAAVPRRKPAEDQNPNLTMEQARARMLEQLPSVLDDLTP